MITIEREHSTCSDCDASVDEATVLAKVTGSVESSASVGNHRATVRRTLDGANLEDILFGIITRHTAEGNRCPCSTSHELAAAEEISKLIRKA